MSNVPFSQRLGAFKQRFQQVLGNRGSGYDELAQLEQPLVGDDSSYGAGDNYEQSHGVSRPGQYSNYTGIGGGSGGLAGSALPGHVAQTIPSQVGRVVYLCHAGHAYHATCRVCKKQTTAAGRRIAVVSRACSRCCWPVVGAGCHA